jgi:hypothetical protein
MGEFESTGFRKSEPTNRIVFIRCSVYRRSLPSMKDPEFQSKLTFRQSIHRGTTNTPV